MAKFNFEVGSCTGRGFANVNPSGLCARFKEWIVKPVASGGPEWYILDDYSEASGISFSTSDVNVTGNYITVSGHQFFTSQRITFSSTGTVPAGLTAGTLYKAIYVDDNTIQVGSSWGNANAGTAIDITGSGTGTHTVSPTEYALFVSDISSPGLNDYNTAYSGYAPKIVKFGYFTAHASHVNVQYLSAWDSANRVGRLYWAGFSLDTYDAADFAYDFRGGEEFLCLTTRTGSTYSTTMIDNIEGDDRFVKPITSVGVLTSGAISGSLPVLQLASGVASNFAVSDYCFIYDLNGHTWVNYNSLTAVDAVNDTITMTSINHAFPSGSVVGAYPHRHYGYGTDQPPFAIGEDCGGFSNGDRYNRPYYPYCSSTTYPNYIQSTYIQLFGYFDFCDSILNNTLAPDHEGYYACQRPLIIEDYDNNGSETGDRCWGTAKSLFFTKMGTMAKSLDYRTINSKDYLYLVDWHDNISYPANYHAGMILHTPSLT